MITKPYDYLGSIINLIVGIVEVLLGLRLVLKFFGANPSADFVQWVYRTTTPILGPFRGIFPTLDLEGPYILEFTTVFAMLVYALLGYFLLYLVSVVPTAQGVEEEEVTTRRRRR